MQGIFEFIFNFFKNLLAGAITNVFNVFGAMLRVLMPDFANYFNYLGTFINNYIVKGVHFVKMVIVNILNIDHNIFTFLVYTLYISLSIWLGTRFYRLAHNIWRIYRGNNTKGG